jgi:hypothetical protein
LIAVQASAPPIPIQLSGWRRVWREYRALTRDPIYFIALLLAILFIAIAILYPLLATLAAAILASGRADLGRRAAPARLSSHHPQHAGDGPDGRDAGHSDRLSVCLRPGQACGAGLDQARNSHRRAGAGRQPAVRGRNCDHRAVRAQRIHH